MPASTLSSDQLGQLLVEARAELDKKNADRAVQLATRVIDSGNSKFRQEAQELLGNARESRGQTAHARAEYQDYLRDYPAGPGAVRVRARLTALESLATPATGGAAGGTAEVAGTSKVALGDKNQGAGKPGSGKLAGTGENGTYLPRSAQAPAEWAFTQYGSLSAFYNLNQGGRGFIETPRTNIGWDKENPYKTYQNSVLGNFDYDARFENAAYSGRMRISASNQHDFIYGTTEETRVSALFFDAKIKDSGSSARIGRQTNTSGGVLGRFDGATAGYKFGNGIAINGVAGAPVERSSDVPFANDDYFYGVSTDLTWANKTFETSGYIIEQRKDGRVDRQSVGLDGRYVKDGGALFATAEYDIHFMELNSAVLSASQYFADQSTASVNLDYRRAPILLVSNALQGQGVFKLSDLLQRYSAAEVDRIALDRTAESVTGTVALSRPLNNWLQWNGDVTVNRLGGMPASGGMEAVESTGVDYFISSQLTASSLWREGDMATGGLRFADGYNTSRYLMEFGLSYPINQDWRVNPMLRLGYMQYKTDTRDEYQFLPSVRTSYSIFRDTMLELELGGKFIQSNSDVAKEYQTELLFLAGIRHDFSSQK
ncbi:MAG: tetratricopeptide repeat protein [Hyphomicrobiaceae bacterium]